MTALYWVAYVLILGLCIYIPNAIYAVISERPWRERMALLYPNSDMSDLPPMWKIFLTCGMCSRGGASK